MHTHKLLFLIIFAERFPVMDATERNWRDDVLEKLVEVFKDQEEDLCRILYFLDEEDKAYKDCVDRPYAPQWQSLRATVKMDKAFREFAKRLSNETKRAENDDEFRKRMNIVHEQMMSHCDDAVGIEDSQKLDPSRLLNRDSTSASIFGGLTRAWNIIPCESQVSVMNYLGSISSRSAMTAFDDVVGIASKAGGAVVMVGLAAVYLSYNAYINIKRWWNGEISGKRCIKNLLDATFTIGAGMAGGISGAAFGSTVGPIGTVVGGIVGGWVCAAGTDYLSDLLTQKLFGLPKDEALENAYLHLGVVMTASNAEVNTAFRQLCLQHHPDKGGNQEDFFILQCKMGIIKQARGDF
jgi:hypothetical protein